MVIFNLIIIIGKDKIAARGLFQNTILFATIVLTPPNPILGVTRFTGNIFNLILTDGILGICISIH